LDITNHGTSYPSQASNSEYDVTGNSYLKNGDLTPKGISEMKALGQAFKQEYVDTLKFMPSSYDPSSVYLQSYVSQSSLMSAYSFLLGIYPDSIAYLNLNMDNAIQHQKAVRTTLGLQETPSSRGARSVDVNLDEGFLYWSDPASQCPAVYNKVQSKLKAAGDSANSDYDKKLYPELADTFKKSKDKINFSTAHLYLEDYLAAKNLGFEYPRFKNQKATENLISEYERDYYYNGLLGGNSISRVIAHPLLDYMLVHIYGKAESDSGKLKDVELSKLKHSHFFTNEVAFAAFLKAVGYPQSASPAGGDHIRFELFKTNGKYYVRGTLNGVPLSFSEAEKGIFELDTFLKVIYPMMYFGDIKDVCTGAEDISLNVYPKCQNYQEYLLEHFRVVGSVGVVGHAVVPKCRLREKVVQVPVRRPETTAEHKVDLISVGFVEIVQIPQPKVLVETKVVEVDRPYPVIEYREIEKVVPVIEEKVVVHEVEKLVAEPPTHIHHIDIGETPIAPVIFEEEFPPSDINAWPWWWLLIPLLCLIPLLALCCCYAAKPKPVPKPKAPIYPQEPKPLIKPKEKEIMRVKASPQERNEKKFVIEKKVVDEGEEIEMEITRELQKSRVMRESRAASAYSLGRQTAGEIAVESGYDRRSGGGRRRRIKTIKKFGQVIGREEQILDEDGNVIKAERIGLDENEAASDHHLRSVHDVGYTTSYSGGNQYARGADGTDHYFKESYERESNLAPIATSSALVEERRSRRGYSSGRHLEGGYRVGGGLEYEEEKEYGRYSPGGRRYTSGGGRYSVGGGRYSVGGTRYSPGRLSAGGSGGYTQTKVQRVVSKGSRGGYGSKGELVRNSRATYGVNKGFRSYDEDEFDDDNI
jgi:hypothetical protein